MVEKDGRGREGRGAVGGAAGAGELSFETPIDRV